MLVSTFLLAHIRSRTCASLSARDMLQFAATASNRLLACWAVWKANKHVAAV